MVNKTIVNLKRKERGTLKHDNVKKVLFERGISIRKCAADINISQPDLCNAVNGVKPMYPKYKHLLSEYLGIDEAVLFPKSKEGAESND
ncbi:MAG: hypothetical protein IJH64_09830 [Oscillospiraceae bacterium]|nr:hypothetical protein [Oscillospiraceae bacterium]